MKMLRPCPVCGIAAANIAYANTMAPIAAGDVTLDMSYKVSVCQACGVGYAAELPAPEEYEIYYRAASKYDLIVDRNNVPIMVQALADDAARYLHEKLPQARSVYDIGCSVGVFLASCKAQGVERVSGIDPAPRAQQLAAQLYGVDIDSGFFDGSQSLAEWDVVSIMAVLEHLWSPLTLLQRLAGQMRAGAYLLVEVPAGDCFDRIRGEVFGELSLEHINFFGQISLRALAARAGFHEVDSEHCFYPNQTWGVRSLFRLGEPAHNDVALTFDAASAASMQAYIHTSGSGLAQQWQRLHAEMAQGEVVIYGAGSHTARLLGGFPFGASGPLALLDGNANLQGKTMGGIPILAPTRLADFPRATVLVSSYHAREAISRFIRQGYENRLVDLYDDPHGAGRPA